MEAAGFASGREQSFNLGRKSSSKLAKEVGDGARHR